LLRSLACALLVWSAPACTTSVPRPTPAHVERAAERWPEDDVDEGDLGRGRRVYVTQCSRCHALEPPGRRSAEVWIPIIADMGARAGLSVEEHDLVLRYVVTASEVARGERGATRHGHAAPSCPGRDEARGGDPDPRSPTGESCVEGHE